MSVSDCRLPTFNLPLPEIGNLPIGNVIGRGGQNRTVTSSSQDSDAGVTPHPVEDRFRVPSLKFRVYVNEGFKSKL